jgi:hypothetical protein
MGLRIAQFLAIVLTAMALVPAGAHFFELPNKIGLPQEPYFIIQNIYRGWALFGIVLIGALVANLALTVLVRHQRGPFRLALLAFLLVAGTLVVFFTWTYPTIRPPPSGPRCPPTGRICACNGSMPTRRMRS